MPRFLHVFAAFLIAFITLVSSNPTRKHGATVAGIGIPVSNTAASDVIANRYIVVYYNNATDLAVETHQSSVMSALKKRNIGKRSLDGRELSIKMESFSMSGWRGISLEADDSMILEIAAASEVNFIEADTRVKINGLLSQSSATSGLSRISHAGINSNAGYVFDNSSGAGIVAYVVDTGIMTTHQDYGGRATFGANFVNSNNTDENGHGSHVAGTIGGTTFGVAKSVNLVAVKVLDANGAGTNSAVINGLNFVATNSSARGLSGKAVMNISIGGSKSNALNAAIAALVKAGITCVVAAGNENVDAVSSSPASAPAAITVGAIDQTTDAKASFSNFGTSVDIFAPGVKVQSVGIASNTATNVLSGTSMASPHVCGLAAYLMSKENITVPANVVARMQQLAIAAGSTVTGNPSGTTTLIAYNGDGF